MTFLGSVKSLPSLKGDMTILTKLISSKEVEKAIQSLRTGRAPGSDGITADFYKHFTSDLLNILAAVFNELLEKGELIETQNIAIIILLFKKGATTDVGNY